MPFTLRNIKEDLEDIGPRFDGAPDLEFRAGTKQLELETPVLVRSPSFTLINRYAGHLTVYHIDLYRVDCVEDLDELGLDEVLEGDGVAVVEWAERLGPYRPRRFIEVRLTDRGGSERELTILDAR